MHNMVLKITKIAKKREQIRTIVVRKINRTVRN
jgi:hypothetical protein